MRGNSTRVCILCLLGTVLSIQSGFPDESVPRTSAELAETKLGYDSPKFLTGAIYESDAGTKRLLYRFERRASRSGEKLNVDRDYTNPDGTPAAKERAVYEAGELTFFELKELQTGAHGSAAIRRSAGHNSAGVIDFTYSPGPGSKPKTSSENLNGDTLVNDMVSHFLVAHMDSLLRGEKVKCRYLVIARRETVGFTFVKTSESSSDGRDVISVRMETTSPLLAALVKPVFFTIEKAKPHRVLQYVGRTTPKLKEGNKWKDLDALTVFDWDHARP